MSNGLLVSSRAWLSIVAIFTAIACHPVFSLADEQPLPAAAARKVDFVVDIRPILAKHCYACHGPTKQESGYRLDRKQAALGMADRGERPIVPGKSGESSLVRFVSGADEETVMPPKG